MIYILWALLNIALFTLFLVICFYATKLIKEKYGLFISCVFVIGLLSFAGNSKKNNDSIDKNSGEIKKWEFVPNGKLPTKSVRHQSITLKKNPLAKLGLRINYGRDSLSNYFPINAYSTIIGTVSGTEWITQIISVVPTEDNKHFEYHVWGTERWRLLGKTVFTREMNFEGTIEIE